MNDEELVIMFEHRPRADQGDRYLASIRHNALSLVGGPLFGKAEAFVWDSRVHATQADYSALIQYFHGSKDHSSDRLFDQPGLRELGRQVTAILPELAQASLIEAVMRARHRGHRLRIIITVHENASAFLSVPWELIVLPLSLADRSEHNDGFLLLDERFMLVRQMLGVGRISPTAFDHPLRFQSFAARPIGQAPIATKAIEQMLKQHADSQPTYWYAGPGTLEQMQVRLLRHTPQILHLLCHGSESTIQIEARHDLLLTHTDGYTRRASIYDLAPVLSLAPDLRLVLLQACYGAAATIEQERRASQSIALGLLRRGMPFVIAFQGEVAQKPAAVFIDAVFKELARGSSVEQAVTLGRIAMLAAEGGVDWSLPVLYSGQALPEPRTALHRISDGLDVKLRSPAGLRTIRTLSAAVALCLIVAAFTRWLFFPNTNRISAPAQFPAILALWISAGLFCPAVVALLHRGVPRDLHLANDIRRAARILQWMGAYIGYLLGCATGGLLVGALYLFGIVSLIPSSLHIGFVIAVVLWALLCSYTGARIEARQAVALHGDLHQYNTVTWIVLIVLGTYGIIFGAPYALARISNSGELVLSYPASIALSLAVALIAMIMLLDES